MSKERKHRFPIRNAIARAGWNTSVYYSYHVEEGGNSHACYPASDYATSYVEVWLDGNEIREGKHAKYEMCIGSWPTQIIVSLYQMPVTMPSFSMFYETNDKIFLLIQHSFILPDVPDAGGRFHCCLRQLVNRYGGEYNRNEFWKKSKDGHWRIWSSHECLDAVFVLTAVRVVNGHGCQKTEWYHCPSDDWGGSFHVIEEGYCLWCKFWAEDIRYHHLLMRWDRVQVTKQVTTSRMIASEIVKILTLCCRHSRNWKGWDWRVINRNKDCESQTIARLHLGVFEKARGEERGEEGGIFASAWDM